MPRMAVVLQAAGGVAVVAGLIAVLGVWGAVIAGGLTLLIAGTLLEV